MNIERDGAWFLLFALGQEDLLTSDKRQCWWAQSALLLTSKGQSNNVVVDGPLNKGCKTDI